jgi:hypothetical protein
MRHGHPLADNSGLRRVSPLTRVDNQCLRVRKHLLLSPHQLGRCGALRTEEGEMDKSTKEFAEMVAKLLVATNREPTEENVKAACVELLDRHQRQLCDIAAWRNEAGRNASGIDTRRGHRRTTTLSHSAQRGEAIVTHLAERIYDAARAVAS